jgi:Adenylate and Guanylate cyclase catalytic domain
MELQTAVSRANAARSREHQLRLRIGAHWGPVLTDGVAVSGDAVNLCARVAAAADPGEMRLTREMFQELSAAHRLKCRAVGTAELKGVARQVELLVLDWRDRELFPTHIRIEETADVRRLPDQDIISFGRLREHEGAAANDVVLTLEDPQRALQISRWHFELRRFPDGFRLRPLSDRQTEVDGAALAKNGEVAVRAGSSVRVARVLTLTLLSPSGAASAEASAPTRRVE